MTPFHRSTLASQWFELSASKNKHIILPEGNDIRVLKAARKALDLGLCRVSVIGTHREIIELAHQHHISLMDIGITEIEEHPLFDTLAYDYSTIRERESGKPLPYPMASGMIKNSLFFSSLLLNRGEVDGVVAGAINTSASVLRAGRLVLGTAPGIDDISSFYVMECRDKHLGHHGILGFADCAVIIDPTAEQLAAITLATAKSMCELVDGFVPRIALLSFSSHGSATHGSVDKIRQTLKSVREQRPELVIDGELQVDTALVPDIAKHKAPDSIIQGDANILIFPDLNSANIGYKLVQYFAGAFAHGPFLQGIRKPLNDLSRGVTVDDIVRVMAVTCLKN